MTDNKFWDRVKELCDIQGIKIQDLAKKTGCAASTFFNLRHANQLPKKSGVVDAIAKVLGTSTDYLLTGNNVSDTFISKRAMNMAERISKLSPGLQDSIEALISSLEKV